MADFLFIKNKRFLGLVFIYYRVHEISNAENCSKINKRTCAFIRDPRVPNRILVVPMTNFNHRIKVS